MGSVPKGDRPFFTAAAIMEPLPSLKKILIAYGFDGISTDLTLTLSTCGYQIVGTASCEVNEVLLAVKSLTPQLVVFAPESPQDNMISIVREVSHFRIAGSVVVARNWDPTTAKEALLAGALGILVSPINPIQMTAVLESAWYYHQRVLTLEAQIEARKLLERAKGILMRQLSLGENDAHHRLLRMSQDQCLPLEMVCQSILQGHIPASEVRVKK
jgi:AmiR/NasT family two-component response regulator